MTREYIIITMTKHVALDKQEDIHITTTTTAILQPPPHGPCLGLLGGASTRKEQEIVSGSAISCA